MWCCKHGAAIQGTWVLQPLSLLQLEGCRLPHAVVSPCGSCLFYLLWFLTSLSRCCPLYLNSTRHTGALLLIDRFLSFSNGVWCWRTTILSFGVMLAWEWVQLWYSNGLWQSNRSHPCFQWKEFRNAGGHQVPRSGFVGLLCLYARVLRCFTATFWGRLLKPLYDSARELRPSVNCQ